MAVKEVVVSLSARDSAVIVPRRRLVLTEQKPSIHIGRASKVSSKGFVASEGNGWFESPVMSRQHAQLTANFDNKTITIKDVKSLHGTFYRGQNDTDDERRLKEGELQPLSDGDKVRFGIDIFRSHETFSPCVVDVKVEWAQPITTSAKAVTPPATNTFAVPDYPDYDSESDDCVIESEKSIRSKQSIDLTGDSPAMVASPNTLVNRRNTMSSDVIDLTDELELPQIQMPVHDEAPVPNPEQAIQDEVESEADETFIRGYSSASESESSGQSVVHKYGEDADDSEDWDLDSDVDSGVSKGLVDDYSSESESSVSGMSKANLPAPRPRHHLGSDVAESNLLEDDVPSDDEDIDGQNEPEIDIEIDQSDFSYDMSHSEDDDAESDGFGDGDDANFNNAPYFGADLMITDDAEDCNESLFIRQPSPAPAMPSQLFHSSQTILSTKSADKLLFIEPLDSPTALFPSSALSPSIPAEKHVERDEFLAYSRAHDCASDRIAQFRYPSPSDAAMVKRATNHPSQVEETRSAAQVLGEKTGKYEYFAARESNRGFAKKPLIPVSAVRETFLADGPSSTSDSGRAVDTPSAPKTRETTTLKAVQFPWTTATPVNSTLQPIQMNGQPMPTNLPQEATKMQPAKDNWTTIPRPKPVKIDPTFTATLPEAHETPLAATLSNLPLESVWTASGQSFINNPSSIALTAPERRTRLQSPDLDMTSAFAYHQSKVASAQMVADSNSAQSVRRLPVQDLLVPESVESAQHSHRIEPNTPPATISRPAKRSFDESFKESSVSQPTATSPVTLRRMITLKRPASGGKTTGVITACPINTVDRVQPAEEIHLPEAGSVEATDKLVEIPATNTKRDGRPSKKRRFMEVAACALVGGAAVFSALVGTAPQFA